MNHDYIDIRSRISEPPQWFDENAVPRYCKFSPEELANIYAHECALVEIACQGCQTRFHVAFSRSQMDDAIDRIDWRNPKTLAALVMDKTIHYGDPPNTGCCAAGPTMNSDPIRVLEYWSKGADYEWKRDPTYEIDVSDFLSAHGS